MEELSLGWIIDFEVEVGLARLSR